MWVGRIPIIAKEGTDGSRDEVCVGIYNSLRLYSYGIGTNTGIYCDKTPVSLWGIHRKWGLCDNGE